MRSKSICLGTAAAGVLAAVLFAGCNRQQAASTEGQAAADAESLDQAMGEHTHGDDEKVAVELAKLPEGDRQAAIAQKDCPVSEHALGSMGAPVKVSVDGRDVFICCEGCRDQLTKDPAKYLAKLPPATAP